MSGASERLDRGFFAVDAATLARSLLGTRLVRVLPSGERLSGLIVETEAYLGTRDAASHAHRGKRTPRNESMYGPPGTAYVYFTYGMHYCLNVVCREQGVPEAVLLRAIEPDEGQVRMSLHRGIHTDAPPKHIASGPGRLARALAVDRGLDGADLIMGDALFIEAARADRHRRVRRTPRVGVDYAGDWATRRLRWLYPDSPCISQPALTRRWLAGTW